MKRKLRTKWRIVGAYWLVQALTVFFLFSVLISTNGRPEVSYSEPDYIEVMATVIGSLMVCQAALLQPVRRPRPSSGRLWARLLHSAAGGAAVGVMCGLATLLIVIILETLDLRWVGGNLSAWTMFWGPFVMGLAAATVWIALASRGRVPAVVNAMICAMAAGLLIGGVVCALGAIVELLTSANWDYSKWLFHSFALAVLLSWAAATPVLLSFSRYKPPHTALGRISSRLLMGTMIEAAAVIPLDVMVRRKTDCYCSEGSLWSLTMCWAVGTLILGPAMWLFPLRRRRLRWYQGMCPSCGYDMRGCPDADQCPECGTGWRSPRRSEPADRP